MAVITGGVAFTGFVAPTDSEDTYAVTNPLYGLGGLRTVADTTERDAITDDRREQGMLVFSLADQKHYQLEGATANANWVEFSGKTASFGISGEEGTGYTLGDKEELVIQSTTDHIDVVINNVSRKVQLRPNIATKDTDTTKLVDNSWLFSKALIRTTTSGGVNRMEVDLNMNANSISNGDIDGGDF